MSRLRAALILGLLFATLRFRNTLVRMPHETTSMHDAGGATTCARYRLQINSPSKLSPRRLEWIGALDRFRDDQPSDFLRSDVFFAASLGEPYAFSFVLIDGADMSPVRPAHLHMYLYVHSDPCRCCSWS